MIKVVVVMFSFLVTIPAYAVGNSAAEQAYELLKEGKRTEAVSTLQGAVQEIDNDLIKQAANHFLNMDDATDENILYGIRFVMEAAGQAAPCSIFKDFPASAYKAFNAYWGSSKDRYEHCQLADYQIQLPKTFDLVQKMKKLDDVEGSRKYAHARTARSYIVKAIISPEYSLEDVGLTAYEVKDFAHLEMQELLNEATDELTVYYKKLGIKESDTRAQEALHSYVGYRIERGS